MKRNISTQLKASFLLTVFSLNTLIGFACAVGLDMGFNISHPNDAATEPSVHIHADGKKHHHTPESAKAKVHVHSDGKKHEHSNKQITKQQDEKETPKKNNDGCCNDDVLKFQNLDKNLNPNAKTAIEAPALIAILSIFLGIDIVKVSSASQLHTARYLFPPPPDILISIHRFQI